MPQMASDMEQLDTGILIAGVSAGTLLQPARHLRRHGLVGAKKVSSAAGRAVQAAHQAAGLCVPTVAAGQAPQAASGREKP